MPEQTFIPHASGSPSSGLATKRELRAAKGLVVVPTPEAFDVWLRRAMADLKLRPSHLLREEGRPGSANRVYRIQGDFRNMKLWEVALLEQELRAVAYAAGVELLPLTPRAPGQSIPVRPEICAPGKSK